METRTFTFDFNVTGSERKRLADSIASYMECDKKYLGAPSFAYQVDFFTIDKNGCVSFDDRADSEIIEGLIEYLVEQGFVAASSDYGLEDEESEDEESDVESLTIEMPRDFFTNAALGNLNRLVEAKGALIKKALGAESLPIEVNADKVSFPWFPGTQDADEIKAYTHFISALCDMAKNQKRVTATEKTVDNEKFAFRCLLLRLGFIGTEYKAERKFLLKNLSGSSAFKSGVPTETVTTICYGKEEKWSSRRKAEKFFLEAMNGSEGSEHERYASIYEQLKSGQTVCSDGV